VAYVALYGRAVVKPGGDKREEMPFENRQVRFWQDRSCCSIIDCDFEPEKFLQTVDLIVLAAPPRRLCFIALHCPTFGEAGRPNGLSLVWNRIDEAIAPGASRRSVSEAASWARMDEKN